MIHKYGYTLLLLYRVSHEGLPTAISPETMKMIKVCLFFFFIIIYKTHWAEGNISQVIIYLIIKIHVLLKISKNITFYFIIPVRLADGHLIQLIFPKMLIIQLSVFITVVIFNNFPVYSEKQYYLTRYQCLNLISFSYYELLSTKKILIILYNNMYLIMIVFVLHFKQSITHISVKRKDVGSLSTGIN